MLLVILVYALLSALLSRQTGTTWAQPNQSNLNQSIPTEVQTATAGPTATRTATPAAGVYRVLLQEGRDGYQGTSDTFITSYYKDQPAADRSRLKIKGPDVMSPLIRFDLTGQLPEGAYIVQAELVFYVESGQRQRTLDVSILRVLRSWDVSWTTWNSASAGVSWGLPGCNLAGVDRLATADDTRQFVYRAVYYGFDVTDSLRYWQEHPSENYGWVLKSVSSSTGEFDLLSSLNSTTLEQRPILRIDYMLDVPTPTVTPSPNLSITATETPEATPTATPGTPTTSPTPSHTPQPTTQTIEAVQDTTLNSWDPTASAGSAAYLYCYTAGEKKVLVQFDLSSLPAWASVEAATLQMRTGPSGGGNVLNITAYRLLKSWQEATATWRQAATGTPWSVYGAAGEDSDYAAGALDSVAVSALNQTYAWDVTAAVQSWVNDGQLNAGLLLAGGTGTKTQFAFLSSEAFDYHPSLSVTYRVILPTWTPTATPSPTATHTPTPTATATATLTSTPLATPTATPFVPGEGLYALVFEDLDRDGGQDADEPGIAGVNVELYTVGWQSLECGVTTDEGYCSFGLRSTGEYRIVQYIPWNDYATTDSQVRIYHAGGQTIVAFGLVQGQTVALPFIAK